LLAVIDLPQFVGEILGGTTRELQGRKGDQGHAVLD
jgi:hypothetical protein